MRRRSVVVAGLAVALLSAWVLPSSAASDVGPVPIDDTPVYEYDSDGETGGHVVTVGVERPRADGVQLVAGCHYVPTWIPNSNRVVLKATAQASATSVVTAYGVPVSVGVTCTVHPVSNGALGDPLLVLSAAAPGTTVATAGARVADPMRSTVCTRITAVFSGNRRLSTQTRCMKNRRTDVIVPLPSSVGT